MTLTGKAKELFEKWFNEEIQFSVPSSDFGIDDAKVDDFETLPQPMQWGVYLDWADWMGYRISVEWRPKYELFLFSMVHITDDDVIFEHYANSRSEGQVVVFRILNKLINEK